MNDEKTILGIIGGGQLGRMMITAASNFGVRTLVLDPNNQCPAASFCHSFIAGSLYDATAIESLLKSCTIATIEIEHLNAEETLLLSKKLGVPIYPSMEALIIIQDKYKQKQILHEHGFTVAPFCSVSELEEHLNNIPQDHVNEDYVVEFFKSRFNLCFGFPLLVKSKKNAYDGHGTSKLRNIQELVEFLSRSKMENSALDTHYIEAYVPFCKELSVLAVVSRDESQPLVSMYPVVETIQHNHICHAVIAPAQIELFISEKATAIASSVVHSLLKSSGVFAIEMFLLGDGSILINEIAPRPHNSGHFSIDACVTSQFENHVRSVLKMPTGSTRMTSNAAVMINILGDGGDCPISFQNRLNLAMAKIPGLKVHWYGKSEPRKSRKLGHITLCGDSISNILYSLLKELPKCNIPFHIDIAKYGVQSAKNSLLTTFGGLLSHSYMKPMIGIIMGSDSDMKTMSQAIHVLTNFSDVSFEVTLVSAHRTPKRLVEYGQTALNRGIRVVIAGAGGAAHLPGMIASLTTLPVIGVPIVSDSMSSMHGKDALYSILQMPTGVPVATVAVGNAANAALLALRILASGYFPLLEEELLEYQLNMAQSVLNKVDVLSESSSIQSLINSQK